ncbi:hypothetical protein D8674_017942 [Pyrus ussuriensis x Pyrus communis]|uniref:Uncharacterized protein n=1 Tax=Pyrus ussuriensis x Pyrus communis TaxID=2448454 RepID=A0A5N5HJH0_9ROSA|nr:hypothetical protein D8674_017942 [Pyrus ussuriensis x Pyrus communis]
MVNLNLNANEYYNYHKAYGHMTRNWRNLKEFIEDLLDSGYYWEFVAKKADGKQGNARGEALMDKNEREERPVKRPTLHINCIYGTQDM